MYQEERQDSQAMEETISKEQLNKFLQELEHLHARIVTLSENTRMMNLKQKANLIKAEQDVTKLRRRVVHLEEQLKLSKLKELEAQTDAADMEKSLQDERNKLNDMTEEYTKIKTDLKTEIKEVCEYNNAMRNNDDLVQNVTTNVDVSTQTTPDETLTKLCRFVKSQQKLILVQAQIIDNQQNGSNKENGKERKKKVVIKENVPKMRKDAAASLAPLKRKIENHSSPENTKKNIQQTKISPEH